MKVAEAIAQSPIEQAERAYGGDYLMTVTDQRAEGGQFLVCWHRGHMPPSVSVEYTSLDEFAQHYPVLANTDDWEPSQSGQE